MLISLEGMKFHSPLGYYDEEQILGTDISITLEVEFNPPGTANDQLTRTFNYETLYDIVSNVAKRPMRIIESYCSEIINMIILKHKVARIKVKVCKLNPPLKSKVDKVCVEMERVL